MGLFTLIAPLGAMKIELVLLFTMSKYESIYDKLLIFSTMEDFSFRGSALCKIDGNDIYPYSPFYEMS